MQIRAGYHITYECPKPTPMLLMLSVHPSRLPDLLTPAGIITDPELPLKHYRDLYGNTCSRLVAPAGRITLATRFIVEDTGLPDLVEPEVRQVPVEQLPDDVLVYLLPSRYCQSDELADFAFEQFGGVQPGWSRVQAISEWVHGHIGFDYGKASPTFTAVDVLASGHGVCRDFTHLGVALCRALNIPTRYVFGYLPDIGVPDPGLPMDFCAWLEVFLGERWFTFDPRNHQHRIGRTVIGRGRDAADVAMVTTFGHVDLRSMTVVAEEVSASPAPS